MKRNLLLLGLLSILLVITYFFQEKRDERHFHEALTKDRLIQAEQIVSLEWKKLKAVKKDGQWWSGDVLLSHNIFRQIEKKLSEIKKIKEVQGEWKTFFSKPLEFEVNKEKWVIGDMTLDQQGFYLSRGKNIMIAVIEGESHELTHQESEIEKTKLEEIKRIFDMDLSSLKETQLFRFYPKLPLGTVTIEAEGSLSFELDLLKNQTIPRPLKGIEVHESLSEKFVSLLTQMTIRKEVSYEEKLKFKKMGGLTFQNKENKVVWELWLKSDKSADAIIMDSSTKRAFLMVGGTLKVFFVHLQDYWDKKVIPPSSFKHFTRLPVIFLEGNKSAEVEILNREPLAFEATKYQIRQEEMSALFQYVFNLGEKDQADRVSQLSQSERKEILSQDNLRLEVMGQELLFWRKKEELIVVNLTQGFKAHFGMLDESFRAKFEDVLESKP